MKLLLDTHLLLWAAEGFEYLPPAAQTLMIAPENERKRSLNTALDFN